MNRSRAGNAIFLATTVVAISITVLLLSTDQGLGVRKEQEVVIHRLQARSAAEAVARVKQQELSEAANANLGALESDTTLLGVNPDGSQSATGGRGWTYFNNCWVRWQVEPVRLNGKFSASGTARTVVNPTTSGQAPTGLSGTAAPGGSTWTQNSSYYAFRIDTQAFALANPNSIPRPAVTALFPTTVGGVRAEQRAIATVVRLTSMKVESLFKFAIYYTHTGFLGDLDMWSGAAVNVSGSVWSNGSIFFGGQSVGHLTGDYQGAASGGAAQTIGGTGANQVLVVGVDGIYRTRKPVVQTAFNQGLIPSDNPRVMPQSGGTWGSTAMTGNNNLNGDNGGAGPGHKLNDTVITAPTDSRAANWTAISATTGQYTLYGDRVRDVNRGAQVSVPSVQGVPLDGRRIEATRLVGEQALLYCSDPTNPTTTLTVNLKVNPAAAQLFYQTDPRLAASGAVTAVGVIASSWPVYATDMPLYRLHPTMTDKDDRYDVVPDSQSTSIGANWWHDATVAVSASAATFLVAPTYEAKGEWLSKSMYGDGQFTNTAGVPPTGLTIRERGRQNTAYFTGARPSPTQIPGTYADLTLFVNAYTNYLKSQYAVYLGFRSNGAGGGEPVDITDAFFNHRKATAVANTSLAELTCTEDEFIDRRETRWMYERGYRNWSFGNTNASNLTAATGVTEANWDTSFKTNVLTVNWERVRDFLTTIKWKDLDNTEPGSSTILCWTRFNGLMYVHRTPRWTIDAAKRYTENRITGVIDAIAPLIYHPVFAPMPKAPDRLYGNGTAYAATSAFLEGAPWPRLVGNYTITPIPGSGTIDQSAYDLNATTTLRSYVGQATRQDATGRWMVACYTYPLHQAVRLAQARNPSWVGRYITPDGTYSRQKGLTFITPNHLYLWGDTNTVTTADSAGVKKVTPMAVFSDGISALSNAWRDTWRNGGASRCFTNGTMNTAGTETRSEWATAITPSDRSTSATQWTSYGNVVDGSDTTYNLCMVTNNVPSVRENSASDEGSGAVANLARFLEGGGRKYNLTGSIVVMNAQRYRSGDLGANKTSPGYYGAPTRNITFNTDLLVEAGRPPFSPFAITVDNVAMSVNVPGEERPVD